jgi:hypothetical protein
MEPLDYEKAGVRYDMLDAFKRACQRMAATTTAALAAHGMSEPASTRGESAYLIETPNEYLAHVEEGLGTKNLVADAMQTLGRGGFYKNIGIDTVATIVNDLITTGATPISVAKDVNAPERSGAVAKRPRSKELSSPAPLCWRVQRSDGSRPKAIESPALSAGGTRLYWSPVRAFIPMG